MKAETLADYRTRIADRTLITLSVVSIERILDERLRLLAALDHAAKRIRVLAIQAAQDHQVIDEIARRLIQEADVAGRAIAYADEPVP